LTLIASEREAAAEAPILFPLKCKLVNTVLTLIASEREPAAESPIKNKNKYKLSLFNEGNA